MMELKVSSRSYAWFKKEACQIVAATIVVAYLDTNKFKACKEHFRVHKLQKNCS